jgi:hypothetical protein
MAASMIRRMWGGALSHDARSVGARGEGGNVVQKVGGALERALRAIEEEGVHTTAEAAAKALVAVTLTKNALLSLQEIYGASCARAPSILTCRIRPRAAKICKLLQKQYDAIVARNDVATAGSLDVEAVFQKMVEASHATPAQGDARVH